MAGKVFIGTSGWNYADWRDIFYGGAPASEFLKIYAKKYRSVEVNRTFYGLLKTKDARRWAEQTPPNFVFAIKGSRFITHILHLKSPRTPLKRLMDPLKGLKKKLGPVLFQLPPKWDKDTKRLADFLDALPAKQRYTFELRDPRWIADDVLELFRRRNIAFCIYDFDGRQSPRHVTADFAYIRLHGPAQRYRGNYTEAQLEDWAQWIKTQTAKGIDVYCYFDNTDKKAYAAKNAKELENMLAKS